MTVRQWISGASLAALAAASAPAFAQTTRAERRVDVTPYIGVDQVVMGPLKGGGDVLTYSNVTAGLTAEVQNRRVEAVIDLQYNHSFSWSKQAPDQDVLSGIASANVNLARGLSLHTGGMASRVRTDGLSGASTLNDSYTSQVYAGYIGPAYTTQIGDITVNGSYRLGYARVEDDTDSNLASGSFADSWTHSLTGSVGFAPGTLLPVGLTASAGYDREDASQLDQRFEDKWGRVDATLPVSRTVALIGGIGYEQIEISQRSPLLDTAGVPVIRNGRYVTDKSSLRALVYEFDDIIWDAGVLWRPSRRTSLQAQVGQRYGGMTYQGSFTWQGSNSSFAVIIFDGIDSFGRLITANAAALSGSSYDVARNPFTGDITGCAFSTTGGGQCFNDALAGITDANFRYRGVSTQYSLRRGPWGWGVGTGYSQRKFITPQGQTVLVRGSKDQNWYGNGSMTYMFNDRDSIDTVAYINYFDASGGRPDVLNYGAFTSYYKGLTRRLSASASVGVDGVQADDIDTVISAMGQVGLRYSF
ncbi:hypothetical protein D0Z70_03290 [Sphingobium terrigena]|uniref:Preprotein translocase subunit YajC n=1 Tax=Sphingobium terrigena TaxID=2304063 RepID=A0A418YXD2_9SPHN|nr:hypothetical protein [Sphingobium terrigena]RJG57247.1 hypothetical protein D0Z70_03290 [Sphingobium terrigena]